MVIFLGKKIDFGPLYLKEEEDLLKNISSNGKNSTKKKKKPLPRQ